MLRPCHRQCNLQRSTNRFQMFFSIALGAVIGFGFGRLAGAVLGGFVGWWVFKTLRAQLFGVGNLQSQFLDSTFAVMGAVCKADGRVDEREIAAAEAMMRRLRLDAEQRLAAIDSFNRGKAAGFDLDAELSTLRQAPGGQVHLTRIFLEVQLQAVLADGTIAAEERAMLGRVARGLGLSPIEIARIEAILRMAQRGRASAGGGPRPASADELGDAYAVLGVERSASDAEIKRAYRKLMSEHHPDKIAAKGLPESMREMAEQKTREITRAYDIIKSARA